MVVLGIDIGGTSIKFGIVDNGMFKHPSTLPVTCSSDKLIEAIKQVIDEKYCQHDFVKIGIGSPGKVIDGIVYGACNLGIEKLELARPLEEAYRVPVFVQNDAYCNLLGELRHGGLQNVHHALLLTIGTGIGGGIVIDGKIYSGAHQSAGEIGHYTYERGGITCTCGNKGCFEQYASTTALVRMVRKALTIPNHIRVTGQTISKQLENGDTEVEKVFHQFVNHLADGIKDFLVILDVEVVCISGGISEMKERLIGPLREALKGFDGKVIHSQLGEYAGVIGASCIGDD